MSDPALKEEDFLKDIFVREWLRTGDIYKAGFKAFPNNNGKALQASMQWPQEFAVLEYRQALVDESETGIAGLPSKHELAREVYQLANNALVDEDKISAYKLTAEILGYIEKGGVNIDNRSVTVNKVMLVKDHGTDEAWEKKLAVNQRQLTHDTEH